MEGLVAGSAQGAGRGAALGAAAGLVWGGALRLWMAALVGEESAVTPATAYGVLVPAAATGAVLGHAADRGFESETARRSAIASPLLVSSVALVPSYFRRLVRTGEGSGAIGVSLTAVTGGYAIGGSGPRWSRITCGALAATGVAAAVATPAGINPDLDLRRPQGLFWVGLGGALVALLTVAAAGPYRGPSPEPVR